MGKVKYFIFIVFIFLPFLLSPQKTQAADSDVVINEVMANAPTPETNLEWVELYNNSSNAVDLKNWTLDGKVVSTNSILIGAQDYLILARNADAFKIHWPDVTVPIVQISMSLSNSSDTIILQNSDGSLREEFNWVSDTGDNLSWERIDPATTGNDNWFPSLISGGTPGAKNSVFGLTTPLSPTILTPQNNKEFANTSTIEFGWQTQNDLKYEFILSKTADFSDYIYDEDNLSAGKFTAEDLEPGTYYWKVIAGNVLGDAASEIYSFEISEPVYSNAIIINELSPAPGAGEEWVELFNNSAEDVNLKNWILEDLKGSIHQYKISDDLIIPRFGYLLIYKSQSGITLNNDEDGIRLIRPDNIVLSETPIYSGGQKGWSFARDSGGVWQWTTTPTSGKINVITAVVAEDEASDRMEEENIPINTTPVEVKTGEIQNYENYLVKLTGTVVETSGNTFYLDDGSGKAKIYIQESTGIDKPPMHKGDIFEIIGIIDLYRGVWRVLPQRKEDIKLIKAISSQEDEEAKSSTAKASSAKSSTAKKSTAATTKARSPTTQKVAGTDSQDMPTKIQSYHSSFWIQLTKAVSGLSVILLILLIIKIVQVKRESPFINKPLGGDFGDDT